MSDDDPKIKIAKLMWGAFLVSHAILLGIAHIVPGPGPGEAGDVEMMSMIFLAMGVAVALGSAFAVPMLVKGGDFLTITIIRFALAESATVFGFVLHLLGAEMLWVYVLAGVGVTAHIAAFPSERERQRLEQEARASKP